MYKKSKNSTQHGLKTSYGLKTPHKMPDKNNDVEDAFSLVTQLYPTGRAWYMRENGVFNNLHKTINVSFLRLNSDARNLIDSNFPDNDNFLVEDCRLFEYKLGLISNENLTLEKRRNIILNKISRFNGLKLRQHRNYIEEQLNVYGFNVGVYENIFKDENGNYYRKNPKDIQELSNTPSQHGGDSQHGESFQHGAGSYEVIANSLFEEVYSIGGDENLWATFFIASKNSIYEGTSIPRSRELEFRELVLKLKPAHTVAFVFITFN